MDIVEYTGVCRDIEKYKVYRDIVEYTGVI